MEKDMVYKLVKDGRFTSPHSRKTLSADQIHEAPLLYKAMLKEIHKALDQCITQKSKKAAAASVIQSYWRRRFPAPAAGEGWPRGKACRWR